MNTLHFFKNKGDAQKIAHTLSITSKMPCDSYSLPIANCNVGSKLAKVKGSICSKCYASKGSYVWKPTKNAMQKRLNSIKDPLWVDAMIKLIGNKTPYFRWHDSGDIQDLDHFNKICQIAKAMPNTQFWIPTREVGIIKEYAQNNIIPTNLIVRLSAMFIDKEVIIPKSLQGIKNIVTSNVHTIKPIGTECKAYQNKNECGSCRDCWNTDIKSISYKAH